MCQWIGNSINSTFFLRCHFYHVERSEPLNLGFWLYTFRELIFTGIKFCGFRGFYQIHENQYSRKIKMSLIYEISKSWYLRN